MKSYILIKESTPVGFATLAAAHGSLAMYLKFKDHEDVRNWLLGPFYKAICKVTDEEFEKAKECEDFIIITESMLNNQEVALAFRPREEWPKSFKFLRLYR